MEKTIKYLENGEYHYATVKDVGDLAKLKTDSKDDLVAAINDLFENGGKNAGKPEGYDKLVDQMADTIKKQQDISGKLNSAENDLKQKIADSNSSNRTITDELNAQIEVERQKVEALRLAAEQARKELNEQVAKLNADSQELSKKTTDLANDVENKFGSVQNDYKTVSENLTNEAAALHKQLGDVKNEAEATKSRIQDQAEDIGNIHKTVDNVSNQVTQKIWMSDLDPVKQQVTQNSTEVQETQNQLKTKAEQSSLDLVANSVEKLDTEVKKNAEGLEVTVKKEEFAENVAELLKDKTNLLLGTRNFAGDKWSNLDYWHEEPGYWNGLKVYSSTLDWYGIQYQYEVKKGNQYTFSFYARQQSENNSAYIVLSEGNTGAHLACTEPYQKSDIHIGTEWKRYSLTFQAIADGTIYPRVEQSVTNNTIYVAGYKLELGKVATPWEPNEADAAENIEHNESKLNVFSDKVESVVKKQEQLGSTQNELETKVTQNAEGLKQASHQLEDANGKINKFQGDLESTAKGLKASYEEYTNKAIGQISDSSLNLIRNGSFSNKDSDFDQWQNVSAKVNIREDENGLRWVELTQSGMTTDNPQGITSNYFVIKQGKVTVAVDIKLGDKANLDNQNILLLELYNDNKQRVDFTDVSVSQLGLSTAILNDHNTHRGLYRLGIDRKDVKYMTVKAHLIRNGDLWFTNFSARLSSIDDGGYTPNPDDVSQQILKQNTKIEQNAKEVAIKANSVDVTRDIKDAVDGIQVGGRNLASGTNKEYAMGYGIPTTTWKDGYAYETLPLASGSGEEILPQDPHTFFCNLNPGREYTQTVWLETDATVKDLGAAQITWWTTIEHDFQSAKIQKLAQNKYKLYSTYTWPGKDDNNVRLFGIARLENAFDLSTGTYIKFGKLKLEEGNVSTDWSPAPEDTSAEIKSAKDAAIQVASDQINLHVNELTTSFDDKLNKRVNEVKTASEKFTSDGIEQTVTKITNVKNDVDRLDQRVATNNGGGINLLRGTGSEWKTLTGSVWFCQTTGAGAVELGSLTTGDTVTYSITVRNNSQYAVRPEIVGFSDDNGTRSFNTSGTESVQPGETKTVSVSATVAENTVKIIGWLISSGAEPTFSVDAKNEKLERGSVATPWSPNPQDAKTYTDSQIVNTNKKIDTQTLDSANIDEMKTQGHYFVHSLTGNPLGSGWVYVDVIGNNSDRIRQDVYQDNGSKHMYRRLFGSSWSGWEQGAYLSDVNAAKTEVTASVKNLGDRVTTEVNSITTKINDSHTNDVELIRNNNFPDGNKGSWNGNLTTVVDGNSIPAELGQNGMKVLRVAERDTYEDGIWYSVKPGEIFDVDYWIWPTYSYDSQLGLYFVDKDKGNSTWRGVVAKKGTGWTHYTGTIEAPSNAAFAKPWIQIDKDANDTGSAAWIGKPSIRRHDTFAEKKISEINTKLDVANGKIEGKVTETQVNDILNGKGYATQSWAESNFRMKSDSIELEVRKITDPISGQVNNVSNKLDNLQVGGRNYLRDSDKTITGWGQDLGTIPHETLNELAGKTITVSCDVEWSGYAHDNSRQNRLGFEASVTGSDGHNYWIGAWVYPSTDSGKERVSAQYTLPAGVTFAINNNGHNGYVAINGSGKVSHVKIEIGNRMTDWTPAPEDATTAIQSNTTAINQNKSAIALKADQTVVDAVKNTASQNSSRLDVMANEIQSKVTSTDVNNIVDSKGYATTSTVQSLITQKAGSINETITNLTSKVNSNNGGGINLLTGTGNNLSVTGTNTSNQTIHKYSLTNGYNVSSLASRFGTQFTLSFDWSVSGSSPSGTFNAQWDNVPWDLDPVVTVSKSNTSGHVSSTFSVSTDSENVAHMMGFRLDNFVGTLTVSNMKLEKGSVATPWSPAPSDNATVTQVQQITATIDGLQSTVANKADKSQITQLSNLIQSKVSSSDFNDLKDKTLWKSTDSIDLNTAVSQQKIFVKGGSNLPPGPYWWYVQVEPGYHSRIVQYAVSDRDNIHYSRQYNGAKWSAWSQGATESEITQLRDDINLRVKSGDLLSQINLEAGRTLIQSNKIYLDANSVIMGPNTKAFIPSAAITNVDADIINTGVLNGIEIRQVPTNGRSIDIKDGNIAIASNDPYEPRISFTNNGKDAKMFNAVGDLEVLNQEFALFNFTPEDTHSLNPIPFFKVTNTGQIGSGGAQLNMDHAIFDGYEWWTPSAGVTFGRTWNGVDKSSDYADIYAKSFVPHSELSAKTRIKKLDRKEALDKIMQDDMYTYQFKEDVRDGVSKRYASFIIDNIHDVAQYTEPEEFLSANGKGRDDGTQLAYLIAAVQYQQEQIEELKKKLEEK